MAISPVPGAAPVINGYRSPTDVLNGTHHMTALGACTKMFWSEYHQDVMELAIDILGMEGQILTGTYDDSVDVRLRRGRDDYPVSDLHASLFLAVGDHLGRDGGDSAQHRRRTGAWAPEGAQAGELRQVTR